MKIQKRKLSSKTLIATGSMVAVILLATGGLFAYNLSNNKNESPTSSKPAESDKKQAQDLAKNPENKEHQVNTDVAPTVKIEPGKKAAVSMVASANILEDKLYIRGGLNGAVVTDGQCFATIESSSGAFLRKDTPLLQNASTTDCKTIIINLNELSKGKWTAVLNFSSNTMEGTSNEASFEIN